MHLNQTSILLACALLTVPLGGCLAWTADVSIRRTRHQRDGRLQGLRTTARIPTKAFKPTAASRTACTCIFELKGSRSSEDHHHQKKVPLQVSLPTTTSFPPGCSVELVDPETKCQVILLGCFHGSQSSASDVVACLSQPSSVYNHDGTEGEMIAAASTKTVIALELCASRFADLRRDVLRERAENNNKNEQGQPLTRRRSNSKPWVVRLFEMVQKISAQRGWATGIVTALLGGVSGIQTGLSGLQPGLEFRTALTHVLDADPKAPRQPKGDSSSNDHDDDKTKSTNHHNNNYSIVLVDQNVDETLEEIGKLPLVALELWTDFLFRRRSWEETFGLEARALARAVGLGIKQDDDDNDTNNTRQAVSILGFVTRSSEAAQDMVRLLLPPMLGLPALVLLTHINNLESLLQLQQQQQQQLQNWMMADGAAAAMSTLDLQSLLLSSFEWPSLLVHLSSVAMVTLGYLTVVLPAARVILRERDDVMAQNIRAACRFATQTKEGGNSENSSGSARVVAVLGLLHVNGIAQRLLQPQKGQDQETSITIPVAATSQVAELSSPAGAAATADVLDKQRPR